jgi:cytochrome c553
MLFSEIRSKLARRKKTKNLRISAHKSIPFRGDLSMKLQSFLAAFCLVAIAGTAQAADPNLGRNLAATCANCHGTNGRAVPGSGLDSLAGVEKAKTLQKLADFKTGVKPASIMHQITKGYSDEQLDLIATYFAAQK